MIPGNNVLKKESLLETSNILLPVVKHVYFFIYSSWSLNQFYLKKAYFGQNVFGVIP